MLEERVRSQASSEKAPERDGHMREDRGWISSDRHYLAVATPR